MYLSLELHSTLRRATVGNIGSNLYIIAVMGDQLKKT